MRIVTEPTIAGVLLYPGSARRPGPRDQVPHALHGQPSDGSRRLVVGPLRPGGSLVRIDNPRIAHAATRNDVRSLARSRVAMPGYGAPARPGGLPRVVVRSLRRRGRL